MSLRFITSGVLACALWFATSVLSSSAHAAFSCGPGWLLYRNGDGVRCVHGAADGKFVWYGEGHNGDFRYRHIGVVRWDPDREGFYGSAADIHGNNSALVAAGQEEGPANHFDGDIRWTSQGETPETINISPWNDTWTRVPSGTVENYTTPFIEPAIDCDLFRGGKATLGKFRAQRIEESGTQRVNGVRCALKLEGGQTYWDVWYGAGTLFSREDVGPNNNPRPWNQQNYLHLGFADSTDPALQSPNTSLLDICVNGWACSQFVNGLTHNSVSLQDGRSGIIVRGPVEELWLPSRAAVSLHVKAIQLATDSGVRVTPVTGKDVRDYLEAANLPNIWGSVGIEFLFYENAPPDLEGDLITRTDAGLNVFKDDPQNLDPAQVAAANWYGELYPDRLVALFMWGPNDCPSMTGIGSLDWSFIKASYLRGGTGRCSAENNSGCGGLAIGQLAHELGHAFGLGHTFKVESKSIPEAEMHFVAAGRDAFKAFDGDGIEDTTPDPMIHGDQPNGVNYGCDANATAVGLAGVSVAVPHDNIMGYSATPGGPAGARLTPGQGEVIHRNLRSDPKRSRLQ